MGSGCASQIAEQGDAEQGGAHLYMYGFGAV